MSAPLPNYRPQIDEPTIKAFMQELESLMRKHGMNPITDEEQERQDDSEGRESMMSRKIRCDQYQVLISRVVDPVIAQKCHFGKAAPTTLMQFGMSLIADAVKQKPFLLAEFFIWSHRFTRNVAVAKFRSPEDQP